MTNDQVFQIGLALLSAFGSAIIALLWKLVQNIIELNSKMTLIVERVDSHEKRIDKLEKF